MDFEDRLSHAFLVIFSVSFFLSVLIFAIALPVQLFHSQEVVPLFVIGTIGMVLVSPAILLVGIFLILLYYGMRSLVKLYRKQRRIRSSCEKRTVLQYPLDEDHMPDRSVWRLDGMKGGV